MILKLFSITKNGYSCKKEQTPCLTVLRSKFKNNFEVVEFLIGELIESGEINLVEHADMYFDRFEKFGISASKESWARLAKKVSYYCDCCQRTKPGFKLFLEKSIHCYYDDCRYITGETSTSCKSEAMDYINGK